MSEYHLYLFRAADGEQDVEFGGQRLEADTDEAAVLAATEVLDSHDGTRPGPALASASLVRWPSRVSVRDWVSGHGWTSAG